MERMELDQLLSDAFRGGERTCRELRLSEEDARFLTEHYPAAAQSLGEQWYLISFEGANRLGA